MNIGVAVYNVPQDYFRKLVSTGHLRLLVLFAFSSIIIADRDSPKPSLVSKDSGNKSIQLSPTRTTRTISNMTTRGTVKAVSNRSDSRRQSRDCSPREGEDKQDTLATFFVKYTNNKSTLRITTDKLAERVISRSQMRSP